MTRADRSRRLLELHDLKPVLKAIGVAVGKDRAELVIRQEFIDLSIESCEVLVRPADLQEIARRGRASLPRRR